MNKNFLFVFSSLMVFSFSQFAQAQSDYLLLDEESGIQKELQWVQAKTYVVTASKKKEIAQEAPANITVFTHRQIEQLGVSTLAEVLSFIPGITVMETYFGFTDIIFRGNFQEHYNNKSLFLINGHPAWDMINGSFHLELIPIDAIKRIEVIRGPGSVLYGTNAFAGVINVITFSGKDFKGGKISGKGGAFNSQEYRASFGNQKEDFGFFLSGSYSNSDGFEVEIERDELGMGGTLDYGNEVSNVFAEFSYKNFSLDVGYFKQEKPKIGYLPILLTGGLNTFEEVF